MAKNHTGYENLMQLSSTSFLEGFYYKPRIDLDLLHEHHEDLVAHPFYLKGQMPRRASRENFEEYLDVFGDDYYIKIVEDETVMFGEVHRKAVLLWPMTGADDGNYDTNDVLSPRSGPERTSAFRPFAVGELPPSARLLLIPVRAPFIVKTAQPRPGRARLRDKLSALERRRYLLTFAFLETHQLRYVYL